jgi:hypothetical protein
MNIALSISDFNRWAQLLQIFAVVLSLNSVRPVAHQRFASQHPLPRRVLATFSLFYLLALLFAPLWISAAQQSSLPACCRRAGAHHCAMSMGAESASAADSANSDVISGVSQCPSWPQGFAPSHSQAFILIPAITVLAALVPQASLRLRHATLSRIARIRQLSLRGPPLPSLA